MANTKRSVEKERFWREVVAEQGESGLSVRAFCQRKGISENSFYAWRRELKRRDGVQVNAAHRTSRERAANSKGSVANAGGRLVPVEILDGERENGRASHGHESNLPLEIGTPAGFTLRFDHHASPETIWRLLDVIAQCPMPADRGREGAVSC